jgi:hypothetical protein
MVSRSSHLLLALICTLSCPEPALADEAVPAAAVNPERERARELFKEARALVAAGDHAAACARFEESLAVDDGMGTRFHLAGCYEKLGKLASAQANYTTVAERAAAAGQGDREKAALERAAALEPRLAKLRIDVIDQPGLEVRRDGKRVETLDWGAALALDPGKIEIEASAPDHKPWKAQAEVPEGPALIVIAVPKLEAKDAPAAAVAAAQPEAEPKATEAEPEPTPAAGESSWSVKHGTRTASYVVGGISVAALIAGTTFALQYQTSYNDSRAVCRSSTNCTPAELALHDSLVDDSKRSAALAYVGLGIGGLAALGATLLFVSSSERRLPERTALRAAPVVGAHGSWGAALDGAF